MVKIIIIYLMWLKFKNIKNRIKKKWLENVVTALWWCSIINNDEKNDLYFVIAFKKKKKKNILNGFQHNKFYDSRIINTLREKI